MTIIKAANLRVTRCQSNFQEISELVTLMHRPSGLEGDKAGVFRTIICGLQITPLTSWGKIDTLAHFFLDNHLTESLVMQFLGHLIEMPSRNIETAALNQRSYRIVK